MMHSYQWTENQHIAWIYDLEGEKVIQKYEVALPLTISLLTEDFCVGYLGGNTNVPNMLYYEDFTK